MDSMTKADAAKLVRGAVVAGVTGEDGAPIVDVHKEGSKTYRTALAPVSADTILAYRVYNDRGGVVTVDGQKLTGRLPAEIKR